MWMCYSFGFMNLRQITLRIVLYTIYLFGKYLQAYERASKGLSQTYEITLSLDRVANCVILILFPLTLIRQNMKFSYCAL